MVQTLDALTSHCPQSKALEEQRSLEALINRYKNLIPSLEITMTKTDTLSKCYTYRKEVREVCTLLRRVREQSVVEAKPENYETVDQLIKEQESAIVQLDLQRPNIMSMLQRGKDLLKDSNAPQFLHEEVKSLESGWSQTYDETVEKLRELKTAQQLYFNYMQQKREILELLYKAEQELKDLAPGHYTSADVPADLIAKQQMAVRLREATESLLRKLRDLCIDLTKLTEAEKHPFLEKEVKEIEERLHTTLREVQERVVYLEQFQVKFSSFQSKLGQLQSWTNQSAPQLLTAVQEGDIGPEERINKTTLLQSEVAQKINLLDELGSEAKSLYVDEANNPEAKTLKAQIAALQERVLALNRNVEEQAVTVTKDLENWEKYQKYVQEIKPWVSEAEDKISQGISKPSTFKEATDLQTQAREFVKECETQLRKIQTVTEITHKITTKTSAPDEIDTLHSKWTIINETATQWGNKLDKLVGNWKDFDNNLQKIDTWTTETKKAIADYGKHLTTPQVDKLEKELAKLKSYNKEIAEQQAKLITLTQTSESVSHQISPEGANIVKQQVQELKGKVSDLAEGVRAKINDISDAILARHEFQAKIADFSNWVNQLKGQSAQIDEVPVDKVENALHNVHALLQEHSEKQSVFNNIYSEVKNIIATAPPKESEELNQQYSNLAQSYQSIETTLQEKKQSLEKWIELLNWHQDADQQLSHIKYQLENQGNNSDVLTQLIKETDTIIQKLTTWKENANTIDKHEKIVILDKQTGSPRTADNLVRDIEVKSINLKSQLTEKLDGLEKVKAHWDQFNELQKQVTKEITTIQTKFQKIVSNVKKFSDIDGAIDGLNKLLDTEAEKVPLRENLRKEALQLIKEDIKNVSTIQNTLAEIDNEWDKNHEAIKEQKLKYADVIFAWKEFQESRERVEKEISKISQMCDGLESPNDSIQANLNNERVKKALEALKKSKVALDKMDSKASAIVKKSDFIQGIEPEIRSELQMTHRNWSEVYEKIIKLSQTTESQTIIWKHIDETKIKLLQWLSEQNHTISDAIERPNEVEAGQIKLAKYKEELPAHLSLRQSIANKEKQLANLSGKEVPTLETLKKLIDEQFALLQSNAEKLEGTISTFGEKEKVIRGNCKNISNKISDLREQIIKCEDLSGENSKILERLLTVRQLKAELTAQEPNIRNVEQQIQQLKSAYPTFSETALSKEHVTLKKRYDGVVSHASKIESSLLGFLKKFHNEKYGALQRIIATHTEKVQWCVPEPTSDKYNLEVKLNALLPVKEALEDCEKRKVELEQSLQVLEKVESPDIIKLLTAEKDHLVLELETLKQKYTETKQLLEQNVSQHQNYEKLSEDAANWLKDIENRVRNESSTQVDLSTIDERISNTLALQQEIGEHERELKRLTELADDLSKEAAESRLKQYVQHLNARYQAVVKFVANYLEKLEELKKYKELYDNSIKDVENWLVNAENKVKSFTEFTASRSRPNSATLDELKNFASERNQGQALLNRAVQQGEALFSGITTENREAIRTELRNLRDKSEALIDKVNDIYKQVENIVMQRHSFEDSLSQVKLWITDAEKKLGEKVELDATLSEKKQTLHHYKSLAHDVELHKTILQQLQDKIGHLGDTDAENKLHQSLQNYRKLASEVNERTNLVENYVSHHEEYNAAVEKFHDWLSALTAEAALLIDDTSSEGTADKLSVVENLLAQKPDGDAQISKCKELLEVVIKETSSEGHPAIINSYEEQVKAWKKFLEVCTEAQTKLKQLHAQNAEFGRIITDLENWLKQKEPLVKDQSLRNTHSAKQAHLEKLKSLEQEIFAKEGEFASAVAQAQSVDADSESTAKISQLNTRYQSLKNALKEGINRYEGFVKEHKNFDDEYTEFLKWLSDKQETLQTLSHVVGDLAVLQDRQKQIRELIEERNQKSEEFEALIEKGEKLYTHTSPDGREIVRQQIRNLRTIWDGFTDDLQSATSKLDQCLVQLSDFTATQEQLTKWLKDVEKAMHQHTELKATLQEKRAQLQNHKIMHQEITSHQQLVESVCEKAQQLVDQTQDKSLNIYLQSIKQLYNNIVSKSQDLLNNLEDCVEKHNDFNVKIISFKDWLAREVEKLQEYDDCSGEKADINKRLADLKKLKENNQTEGNKQLDAIKEQLVVVAQSTSPKGVELLKKDYEGLQGLLTQYLSDVGKYN